jgi:hypothetical protein
MLTGPLRATSSLSTLHADVKIEKPTDDARCMRGRITPPELVKLLNADAARDKEEIVINSQKLWVYRYNAAQRLPAGGPGSGSGRRGGVAPAESPTLPLPPPGPDIVDGQHYVVTEVLFDLPLPPRFPRLHWRAFIEVNTCSVLYLRALINFSTGSVYLTDPITATGDNTIAACSGSTILDPLRTDVTLQGLVAANPDHAPRGAFLHVRTARARRRLILLDRCESALGATRWGLICLDRRRVGASAPRLTGRTA